MDMPEPDEWIKFEDAAKICGVTKQMIYLASARGRKNRSGSFVRLEAWKTVAGWVTTQEALRRFHLRLNG